MGIAGTVLFVLIFLLLAPSSRDHIGHVFGEAAEWIGKWSPYSYGVLVLVLVIPVAALIAVMRAPGPPEPENPLARFKAEEYLD
jgi:hypothetical protein